jgi:hypothetical protein
MTGEQGELWWPSPYGPGCCLVCPAPAAVVVVDAQGNEADLCVPHWQYAEQASAGAIRAVRVAGEDIADG